MDINSYWIAPTKRGVRKNLICPICASAIWVQHFRFLSPSSDGQIDGNFETRMISIQDEGSLEFFSIIIRVVIKDRSSIAGKGVLQNRKGAS